MPKPTVPDAVRMHLKFFAEDYANGDWVGALHNAHSLVGLVIARMLAERGS